MMMKLAIPTLLALSHLTTTLAAHDQPKQENLSRVLDADLEANPQARQVLEDQGMLKEGEERKLSNSYSSSSSSSGADAYGYNYYSNTDQTEYDGYQQAWRYLGWYVSCGTPSDRYYASNSHDSQGSNDNTYEGNNYCQRYLMWAGYVDLNYGGDGTGEYAYYDPYTGAYDYTACTTHGGDRCALMDCHDPDSTTWTLMGVYKEASYFGNDAFFEQLFKHEGICLWNDDNTYEFMSDARESMWPQGCVDTGYVSDYGDELYIDLKPTPNGNMTLGLYTDGVCASEFIGGYKLVDDIAMAMGLAYGYYIDEWNTGMEVYKVCQPCRTYNLNAGYTNYDDMFTDDDYESGEQWGNPDDDEYSDANEGYFWCSDDAGYTNVNQCMKFRTHAELEVATWEDLVLATNQGGILPVNIGGTIFGTDRMSYQQVANYHAMLEATDSENRIKEEKTYKLQHAAKPWLYGGRFLVLVGLCSVGYAIHYVFFEGGKAGAHLKEPLNPNPVN